MMVSPESYISQLEGRSYTELLKKRDALLEEIRAFEEHQLTDDEWCIDPAPEVVYQMNLEYLGLLCKLISDTYNKEVIWGN